MSWMGVLALNCAGQLVKWAQVEASLWSVPLCVFTGICVLSSPILLCSFWIVKLLLCLICEIIMGNTVEWRDWVHRVAYCLGRLLLFCMCRQQCRFHVYHGPSVSDFNSKSDSEKHVYVSKSWRCLSKFSQISLINNNYFEKLVTQSWCWEAKHSNDTQFISVAVASFWFRPNSDQNSREEGWLYALAVEYNNFSLTEHSNGIYTHDKVTTEGW